MKRFDFPRFLALFAAAMLATQPCSWPASAAPSPTAYTVVGAVQSRGNYPYLTATTVAERLSPDLLAKVPAAPVGRLVMLNITFRATGDLKAMVELDPTDLQVQWSTGGAAPVLGVHLSKDFIIMGSGEGFFTSMRPDKYELFAIVPKSARMIDLAQRQSDGSFKLIKAKIPLSAGP